MSWFSNHKVVITSHTQCIPIWTLKRKVSLSLIHLKVSQCWDNIGTSLDAPHQVRWLKISAQKGKKRVDLLLAICIQKEESQAIGGRIGKAAEFPSKWRVAGSSLFPVSKAWTRQEDRQGGETFLWSYCYLFKLFDCFPIRCLLVKVTSLFFAKSSINWTTLQEVSRATQNGHCPLRVRQPILLSPTDGMFLSISSQFLTQATNTIKKMAWLVNS